MILNYYKMTGEELERIFKLSKIKADDFAERLGIKKTKLYSQFKQRFVEGEIEERLVTDPDLASKRMLLSVKEPDRERVSERKTSGPSPELWHKSMEMLNETLSLVKGLVETVKDDNRHIKETSKFIQDDAALFKAVVQQGIEQGAIKFVLPKKG
jgi:hypothetical protein